MLSEVRVADCLVGMGMMEAQSVDAIVTDPPYGLRFMGKAWDHGVPGVPFWEAALRLAKPGARLVAFGGTRTYHRLTCAIEDAGWEIEDSLCWLYGSGFPKHESKLKPAYEPIVMARRPGKVTALNVDECRLDMNGETWETKAHAADSLMVHDGARNASSRADSMFRHKPDQQSHPSGRWPANVVLGCGCGSDTHEPSCAVRMVDEQSGECGASGHVRPSDGAYGQRDTPGGFVAGRAIPGVNTYSDTGGASRFFYCAKSSRGEREEGLDCTEIVSVLYRTWDGEDRQVKLRVDTAQSPQRVIVASGTHDSDATAWSTLLFGSPTTAPSLVDSKSTIATATSSITASRTLKSLVRSLTSAHIVVASGGAPNGGSHAAIAAHGTPCLTITNESTGFPLGADSAASITRLEIRGNAGRAADHPTVKPVSLMRWLVRLVTPPNGLVLDPFCGSGTTGIACVLEERKFLGFEVSEEYATIARARIAHWGRQPSLWEGVA